MKLLGTSETIVHPKQVGTVAQTAEKTKGVYIVEKKFADIINKGCKSGKTIETIETINKELKGGTL